MLCALYATAQRSGGRTHLPLKIRIFVDHLVAFSQIPVRGTAQSLLEAAADLKRQYGLPAAGSTKNQVSYGETLRQPETDCSRQHTEIQWLRMSSQNKLL